MYVLVTVLIILASILLILIVLVQNSKGGGLASNFTSSNQVMGVRKTADFLEKATWSLAGALLVFCIVASLTIIQGARSAGEQKSVIKEQVDNAVNQIPTVPPPSNNAGKK